MKYLCLIILILTPIAVMAAELDGEEIYRRDCIACHGPDGSAQTALGKQLKPHPARDLRPAILSREEMRHIVKHGLDKTGMHGHVQHLGSGEIEQVIGYILTLDYPSNPKRGGQMFAKHCSRCHGADAGGKTTFKAPNLVLTELSDIDMAHIIRNGHNATIMGGFKYELGNDITQDIIVWLRLLRYGLEQDRKMGKSPAGQ